MRQLTFVRRGRLEWRDVPVPSLESAGDAIVRPVVAARCDGDAVFLFHDISRMLRVGSALHLVDPAVCASLGKAPFAGPFPYGHEAVAEVVEVGGEVERIAVGQLVVVPWAVSCGTCSTCRRGLTSNCERSRTRVSGYGFGPTSGGWGGLVSDRVRVPYADHMLIPVPEGLAPLSIASASDNLPDAYRTVAPHLTAHPGAPVLVLGGHARSIGLYAAGMAVALGASRVDYLDSDRGRLDIAGRLGANPVFTTRREAWFRRGSAVHAPGYEIAVEASGVRAGLDHALRSVAPGGVCTGVGFYFFKSTPLPLWQMFMNSVTFRTGMSHPNADIPAVLRLVGQGAFDPMKVTTTVAPWEEADRAFLEPGSKVIVQRERLHPAGAPSSSSPESARS
jgi:threonine dehydrogenase-like Zn-dependent dehydrogenase